ncbi:hypothetical protein PoB_001184100 [Plakobranchus ocellatus]|uniref:Uncharacterized protein n=1 Tax=Plakobranchus ocellatus TaxID=259542 RepID=A0AAV3YPW7_9GAST|nr:hypothetical protein PoB_001184100 [Plakobranchus ocellatus]
MSSPLNVRKLGMTRPLYISISEQLEVSTQFACNGQCFCSDSLIIDNVRISDTRPDAVSACLDPSVNETEVVVTSAEGGFVVLELNKDVISLASANFTVRSVPTGSLPCVQCDELVKDSNSTLQSVQCHKPKSYVPSCPVNGLTTNAGDTTTMTLPSETGTTVGGSAANTTTKTVNKIDNNSIIINNKNNNTNTSSNSNNNNNNNNNNSTTNTNNSNNNSNNINSNTKNNINNDHNSSNNKNNKSNNNTSFAVGRQASDGDDPAAADAGVVAGAVVGGILGLLLLVSLGLLAYFRYKRNKVFPGLEKKTDCVLTSAPPAATTVEKRPVITET